MFFSCGFTDDWCIGFSSFGRRGGGGVDPVNHAVRVRLCACIFNTQSDSEKRSGQLCRYDGESRVFSMVSQPVVGSGNENFQY